MQLQEVASRVDGLDIDPSAVSTLESLAEKTQAEMQSMLPMPH